ncbi:MAG: hypothetical protein F6J93_16720 [Oscillatoria sp. SIO1A7]|nr:hypothetical protein [Oscillatoria sp. SIO1A7]
MGPPKEIPAIFRSLSGAGKSYGNGGVGFQSVKLRALSPIGVKKPRESTPYPTDKLK